MTERRQHRIIRKDLFRRVCIGIGFKLIAIATGAVLCVASAAGAEGPSAREILDRVDDLYRGESSRAIMTMKVVSANWTRELRMEAWSQGKEKSLFRILSPQKERGTATLKSGNQMWNYLPKVKRVIKIPSSMMGRSWMGSHFTNDDLVKESRMAEDYDFEYGEARSAEEVAILCTPKPDAPVVWGKVLAHVRKSDWMPLRIEYFDEEMSLARHMEFADFAKVGTRLLPLFTRIVPSDEPEQSTEIRYEEIEFDRKLDSGMFTLRNLQK